MDEGPERPGDVMKDGVCSILEDLRAVLWIEAERTCRSWERRGGGSSCCSWWLYIRPHHNLAEDHLSAE